jgi:hypothetical protein
MSIARFDSGRSFDDWDYESELVQSANLTDELFAAKMLAGVALGERPMLRALERVIGMLPSMRVALKSWGTTLLHRDVHAGNAMVRRRGGKVSAVLVDWGRARLGSPLEDVSSWLQSAGFWEPEVRRGHDTLFRSYLSLDSYQTISARSFGSSTGLLRHAMQWQEHSDIIFPSYSTRRGLMTSNSGHAVRCGIGCALFVGQMPAGAFDSFIKDDYGRRSFRVAMTNRPT